MNLLLVDDAKSNLAVLKLLIEEWFDDNDIDDELYEFDEVYDGKQALDIVQTKQYEIIFLDIMMPIMDGLEALDKIRQLSLEKQPTIVMVTALDDTKTKQKAKSLKANAYITKPINQEMIEAMLNRYIDKSLLINSTVDSGGADEEFMDFDDDAEFMDFDDFDDFDDFEADEMNVQKDMMNKFNESHQQVPATQFLEDYPDLEYILEDIDDLDHSIFDILDILDETNLEESIEDVVYLLNKYSTFLNSFMDFYELSTSLKLLSDVLENANIGALDIKQKEFVASFIKAILQDLQDWKQHVFVLQDAVDVFYINASSLNSCIQLESYIKTNS